MRRTAVSAVEHVRKLRGGSQAHLLRASDDNYYVTKFQNNPQHVRVLANEFFASRIGISLGLPIPEPQLIEVSTESMFTRVANKQEFPRVLAFDKWLCNCDGRQAVFTKKGSKGAYHATFI